MRIKELGAITTLSYKQPQKLSELQNTQLNLLTVTFLYNLKVNRGKLALINRPWKCKTGKDRRTPLVHFRTEIRLNMTTSPALFPAVTVTVVRDRKIRTALRTNQIAEFVTVTA